MRGYNGEEERLGGVGREVGIEERYRVEGRCGAEGAPWGMVVLYGMTAFTAFVGTS